MPWIFFVFLSVLFLFVLLMLKSPRYLTDSLPVTTDQTQIFLQLVQCGPRATHPARQSEGYVGLEARLSNIWCLEES